MKIGFTLIEIIIVVIIIGILATFAVPQYIKIQEKTLDNEAKVNLFLIQAGENLYKIDMGHFYPSAVHSDLNTTLDLTLPTDTATQKWNYDTWGLPAANPTSLCIRATRNGFDNRVWTIKATDNAPVLAACNP